MQTRAAINLIMRQSKVIDAVFFGIFRCFGEGVKCEPIKSVVSGPASASCSVSSRFETF